MPVTRPRFRDMGAAESRRVLARNHVGRLAFREGRGVDIEPLGYVSTKDWIFLRSAAGSKLDALARSPYVAFEVDEVDGPFDWRSVVVHGTVYMLPRNGSPTEQREHRRAVRLFRSAMPATFTDADPVPEREHVYGLNVQKISGRAAGSGVKPSPTDARQAAARSGRSSRVKVATVELPPRPDQGRTTSG